MSAAIIGSNNDKHSSLVKSFATPDKKYWGLQYFLLSTISIPLVATKIISFIFYHIAGLDRDKRSSLLKTFAVLGIEDIELFDLFSFLTEEGSAETNTLAY